nr:hypothetical protein CFP56_75400 [Quercus suber]
MPELAAAAAAPPRWNSDLKTPSKIYEFAGIPKNLNWVISSRFWIIPKKKILETCLGWEQQGKSHIKNNVLY